MPESYKDKLKAWQGGEQKEISSSSNVSYKDKLKAWQGGEQKEIQTPQQPQKSAIEYLFSSESMPAPENPSWDDDALTALINFPGSAYNVGKGVVDVISNPVQSATNIYKTAKGGVESAIIPGEQEDEKYWKALLGDYGEAYGDLGKARVTAIEDPARPLTDALTLLSGTGLALKGAATAAKAGGKGSGKGADVLQSIGLGAEKVANRLDPITAVPLTVKDLGKIVLTPAAHAIKGILGFTSGAGKQAFDIAFETGKKGGDSGKAFRDAMRGKGDPNQYITQANQFIDSLEKNMDVRNPSYAAHMQTLKNARQWFDDLGGEKSVNKSLKELKRDKDLKAVVGPNVAASVAGKQTKSFTPQSKVKMAMGAASSLSGFGLGGPLGLPAMAAYSPRVMGETIHALGRAASMPKAAVDAVPGGASLMEILSDPATRAALYQSGQINQNAMGLR